MNGTEIVILVMLVAGYIIGALSFCTGVFEDFETEGNCFVGALVMVVYSPVLLLAVLVVYISELIKNRKMKHKTE